MPGAQSRGKKSQQGGRGGYRAGFSEDICPLTLLSLAGRTPAHSSFLWPWASFGRGYFLLGSPPPWPAWPAFPGFHIGLGPSALYYGGWAPLRVGSILLRPCHSDPIPTKQGTPPPWHTCPHTFGEQPSEGSYSYTELGGGA